METIGGLRHRPAEIVERSLHALESARLRHYESLGADRTRLCLESLYDVTLRCLESRNTVAMIRHAENVARERFSSGFDLCEVQTAFNALEEAIWTRVWERFEPTEFFETMRLVSIIIGTGKDALVRVYLSLSAEEDAHVVTL